MRIAPVVAALLVCASFVTSTAHAQSDDGSAARDVPAASPESGYWYQLAAADAISMAAVIGGHLAQGPNGQDTRLSDTLLVPGLLGGLFGAPAVHVAHMRAGRTAASLALHLLLPIVAQTVAMRAAGCEDFNCDYRGGLVPWAIGIGVAGAIDVLWDRLETRAAPERTAALPPRPAPALSVSPVLGLSGNGGVAGLAGRF